MVRSSYYPALSRGRLDSPWTSACILTGINGTPGHLSGLLCCYVTGMMRRPRGISSLSSAPLESLGCLTLRARAQSRGGHGDIQCSWRWWCVYPTFRLKHEEMKLGRTHSVGIPEEGQAGQCVC